MPRSASSTVESNRQVTIAVVVVGLFVVGLQVYSMIAARDPTFSDAHRSGPAEHGPHASSLVRSNFRLTLDNQRLADEVLRVTNELNALRRVANPTALAALAQPLPAQGLPAQSAQQLDVAQLLARNQPKFECPQCAQCPQCPVTRAPAMIAPVLPAPAPSPAPSPSPSVAALGVSSVGSAGSVEQLFAEYCALHRRILSGDSGVAARFVVATPQAQMNNRLRVIISALLLGILTQRAVLVEFSAGYYADLTDLFEMPIDIDLRHFDQSKLRGQSADVQFGNSDQLLCTNYVKAYENVAVLRIASPPSLIPFFYRNVHHHSQLRSWFGSEDTIYRALVLYFLVPNAQVRALRDAHIAAAWRRAENSVVIGVHLRWGGDMRPQPVPDSEWQDMVQCLEAVAAPYKDAGRPVVWFIAADTQESRDRALRLFSSDNPSAQLPSRSLATFHDSVKRSNNPDGVRLAFTELLLLAAADHLVLTPASSFGEQAMAIAAKPAYYVKSVVPDCARIVYSALYEVRRNCLRTHTSQPSIEGFSAMIKAARCFHPDMVTLNY